MEEKKSFVLYCDLIHVLNKLDDENAGKLFKHLLAYVNDLDPEPENIVVELVFEPIKQQMKRDLKRWKNKKDKQSTAGTLGNLKRWHPDLFKQVDNDELDLEEALQIAKHRYPITPDSTQSHPIGSIAVNDNVNVNVNVNDNVNVKENTFSFRSALLSLGVDSVLADEWLKVRKAKKAVNTETAFNALKREVEKSGLVANICIKIAVEKSWSGFNAEWINNTINQKKQVGHEASRIDFTDNTL
jgi:hypothetical protein